MIRKNTAAAIVMAAMVLAGGAAARAQSETLPGVAAEIDPRVRAEFEPFMSAAGVLAARIDGARANGAPRHVIRPLVEGVLQAQGAPFAISIALEPNGFGDKDLAFVDAGPENNRNGRYAADFSLSDAGGIHIQANEMTPASGSEYWYDPILAAGSCELMSPLLYPVGENETPTLAAACPLMADGKAFGVVALDFSYEDLVIDLNTWKLPRPGAIYPITSRHEWAASPKLAAIGYSISDRRAGAEEAEIAFVYGRYRDAGKVGVAAWEAPIEMPNGDNYLVYLTPLRFKGASEAWTLIISLSADAANSN